MSAARDPAQAALAEPSASLATPVAGKDTLHVKVYSPGKIYFNEAATSLSAQNAAGPFDVLPQHHKFISLLEPCELTISRPGRLSKQRIKIAGGLLHVTGERAVVFLDV